MRHALCQVLKHGDEPSDCESSCPCYYSQIEGLGLYVVTITHYVIRIKKHLHNRIEIIKNRKAIIKIKSNRKEYESLHPYHYYIESFLCPSGKRSCIFSKFNPLNVDTPLIWTFFKTPSVSKFIGFNCSNDLLFFNAQPSDYVQMQLRLPTIT